MRCLLLISIVAAGLPLLAAGDFFGNPESAPATPKPVLPPIPPAVVRPPGSAVPPVVAAPRQADPTVGQWLWFNDQNVTFSADGSVTGGKGGPATWTVSPDADAPGQYVVTWRQGRYVDHVTLSADGTKLDGENNKGEHIGGTRLRPLTPPPVSPPGASPAGPRPFQSSTHPVPATGSFYVSVDDEATVFVNGTQIHRAGLHESRSPETELKEGDRVVVQLNNKGGARSFEMLFATSDGTGVVSFRANDFKLVPDLDIVDFTPAQFAKWTKTPKLEHGKSVLPVKSASEVMWGDADRCILACTVAAKMYSRRTE